MTQIKYIKNSMFRHASLISPLSPMSVMYPRTSFSDYLGTGPTLRRKCACGAITRYTVRGRGAKRRTSSALTRTHLTCLWSKTTCIRLTAYARLRHIDKNFPKVPYQGGSGGSLFLQTFCKNVSKVVSEKGPWTDRYQLLKHLRAVHFWILQNQELKPPVDSSHEATFCSPS